MKGSEADVCPDSAQRKIIHVDMDCFYAAIETRDFPHLTGQPIAVGGQPNKRGVVATCNYEARAFGVHSAMPMSQAIKKCPQLIIQPVRMAVYQQVSKGIQAIFKRYTDTIQPLSLDEAFLDVTGSVHHHGSATLIAQAIRHDIYQEHHLAASAGIAPNKFLAKIASDWNKPNGQFVVTPDAIDDFVRGLPVKNIYGVGKVTAEKMKGLGLNTCFDLQQLSLRQLQTHFGTFGGSLHRLCRGIDDRPVRTSSTRKSVSVEDTFLHDLPSIEACMPVVERLFDSLVTRHKKSMSKKQQDIKSLYVKVRFSDFKTTTAQTTHNKLSIERFKALIVKAWNRQQMPVRLLGLGIQYHDQATGQQELQFEE
ncbi:DNA polymerase IV [Marinicella rhabdoformis]|uniref:DNA polymerase IV n=1 Tax=Marinicella rhabdoformis TaxID=2580566 RepID=UPI0012AEB225|nr:DNA polymerase IV [Marinicella rhabdoformis]